MYAILRRKKVPVKKRKEEKKGWRKRKGPAGPGLFGSSVDFETNGYFPL